MKKADQWSGLALSILAAVMIRAALGLPYGSVHNPGPGFFPLWLGVILGSMSIALFVSGKVNVLATTLDKRDPGMPYIPTFKENGFDMAGIMNIYWVGAPAGTPDAVVNHMAEAVRKGVAEPGYAAGMANLGCTAVWNGPADSLKEMNKIEEAFLKLVKKYNLQPQ